MQKYNKLLLTTEFLLIFGILPTVINHLELHEYFLILLWLFALIVYIYLKNSKSFDKTEFWNAKAINSKNLIRISALFFPAVIIITAGTYILEPERFLQFMLTNTGMWVLVMIFYPILSVYPQELIYRSFIFHRYKNLFNNNIAMILASAVAFGYVHIIFNNWVAVILSTFGGLIFATTYHRFKSLGLVCIEHALYGCFIFTVGLGWYFYRGAVGLNDIIGS